VSVGPGVPCISRSCERGAAPDLEHKNRELEAFGYSVSHDLRAPLRSIDGFSQILLEDYGNQLDAGGQDHLRRISAAAQRMGHLIDAMLILSRVARAELRREPVDLSLLAASIAAQLRATQPEREVDFVIPDALAAMGDPHLLRALLENLMRNAWKFTSNRSPALIELLVSQNGDSLVYSIRDNGAGFDATYASKLRGSGSPQSSESSTATAGASGRKGSSTGGRRSTLHCPIKL
jgi:light-regulated signal transduction histidine kinase (bacteriophytochrome)